MADKIGVTIHGGFIGGEAQRQKGGSKRVSKTISIGYIDRQGADGVSEKQLPPELIQKLRESLAEGLARSFISKAIEEIQPMMQEPQIATETEIA